MDGTVAAYASPGWAPYIFMASTENASRETQLNGIDGY